MFCKPSKFAVIIYFEMKFQNFLCFLKFLSLGFRLKISTWNAGVASTFLVFTLSGKLLVHYLKCSVSSIQCFSSLSLFFFYVHCVSKTLQRKNPPYKSIILYFEFNGENKNMRQQYWASFEVWLSFITPNHVFMYSERLISLDRLIINTSSEKSLWPTFISGLLWLHHNVWFNCWRDFIHSQYDFSFQPSCLFIKIKESEKLFIKEDLHLNRS